MSSLVLTLMVGCIWGQTIPVPPLFQTVYCGDDSLGCDPGPKCLLKTRTTSDFSFIGTRCCAADVCGSEYDFDPGNCYPSNVTHQESKDICEGDGRSLCDTSDLAGRCMGTGCSYDYFDVWSNEPCDGVIYEVYSNTIYTIFFNSNETMDWEWAKWLCADTFSSFHSDEASALFLELRENAGLSAYPMWIGVSDTDGDGVWDFYDGSPSDYTFWDGDSMVNEPNGSGDCVAFQHGQDSGWEDRNCNDALNAAVCGTNPQNTYRLTIQTSKTQWAQSSSNFDVRYYGSYGIWTAKQVINGMKSTDSEYSFEFADLRNVGEPLFVTITGYGEDGLMLNRIVVDHKWDWTGTFPRTVLLNYPEGVWIDYNPGDGGCALFSVNFTDLSYSVRYMGNPCFFSPNETRAPSHAPTFPPTKSPTGNPWTSPTGNPTGYPSMTPSRNPSSNPSQFPSDSPTMDPSMSPTEYPSLGTDERVTPFMETASGSVIIAVIVVFVMALCVALFFAIKRRKDQRDTGLEKAPAISNLSDPHSEQPSETVHILNKVPDLHASSQPTNALISEE